MKNLFKNKKSLLILSLIFVIVLIFAIARYPAKSAPSTTVSFSDFQTVLNQLKANCSFGTTGPWYSVLTSPSSYKCDQSIEIHNRFTGEWESSGLGIGYAYYAYTPGDLRPVPPTLNNGQTVYFFIDPDSFGESVGYDLSGKNIHLTIADKNNKQVESFFEFEIITVDKYGNEVEAPKYAFVSAGNGLAQGLWIIYKHKKGNLYLYRITSHSPYPARFDFWWGL